MINFREFDSATLIDFGIVFDNPEEGSQFADFVRKELNKRIDERVIAVVPEEKLLEYKSLKSRKETAEWFRQNCPQFQQIRKEEYSGMVWDLLMNRGMIEGVTVVQKNSFILTALSELGLSADCQKFFYQYNIITIKNALESGYISDLETMFPNWVFELKYKISEKLFPSTETEGDKLDG